MIRTSKAAVLGLIVVIACLSFWLDPEIAAPRVAIGLTSLLTLATQFNNAQKDLPPVAYIKALDKRAKKIPRLSKRIGTFTLVNITMYNLDEYSSKHFHPKYCDMFAAMVTVIFDDNDNEKWLKSLMPKLIPQDFAIENNYAAYWFDPRLKPLETISDYEFKKNTRRSLELPHEFFEQLWRPSTKTMDFICTFNLKLYPFDIQECSVDIEMGTYAVTDNCNKIKSFTEIHLYNNKLKVEIYLDEHDKIEIPPQYKLLSYKIISCRNVVNDSKVQTSGPVPGTKRDCYKLVFKLRRNINSFIILIYIPSGLIVVIACLSFWLDPEIAAPRVAIGLTSLLTLATQFNNAQKDLPPVAYIKALDVWMFFCMFFVFATLVEFTASNYIRRNKNKVNETRNQQYTSSLLRFKMSMANQKNNKKNRAKKFPRLSRVLHVNNIDKIAMILFSMAFLIFNSAYWYIYITEYYAV
uniref:Neurotransmitter-gated ion-channel transmembrane domain-containing protein n=1 Tax=Strigamia maritima TaxID=126957 RepID=T1IS87_STRMM